MPFWSGNNVRNSALHTKRRARPILDEEGQPIKPFTLKNYRSDREAVSIPSPQPTSLATRTLEVQPHHEEIILSLVTPSGHHLCSFTMSELPPNSSMREALDEFLKKLKEWAEQAARHVR